MITLLSAQADGDRSGWETFWDYAELPVQIVVLVVIAFVVRLLLHRIIDRVVIKPTHNRPPSKVFGSRKAAAMLRDSGALYHERRQQRGEALGSLFKSIITAVLGAVVVFMAMDLAGYNLGPILASAGVAGVALGFGAQNLVKDFISGVFMLLEDQYGVGDVIDMGEAIGTVEGVGLRVTRLRDFDGVVWYVRNGEVLRVGNKSQGWSSLLLDVTVSYDEDVVRVEQVMSGVVDGLADDPEWRGFLTERPSVLGVEQASTTGVTLRILGKCQPMQQYGVLRELRVRLKDAFERENIKVPDPILQWSAQGGATAT